MTAGANTPEEYTDMTHTPAYGDPTEWDEIPDAWTEAFRAAIEALGHTVTDTHETAITIAATSLPEGHTWYLAKPNHHGLWAYSIADETGVAPHITWIYEDATDPQAVADTVHAVLTGAPLRRFHTAGAPAVYTLPPKDGTR